MVKPINWRQLSYQIRYVHRASKTERSLSQVGAAPARPADAVTELARESANFMRLALRAAPQLRPAAVDYAEALHRLSGQSAPSKAGG